MSLGGDEPREPARRSAFDYRPGLPFDAFVSAYPTRGDPVAALRSIGHVEQMRQSRCYQQSGGELGCISCHDPHQLPGAGERVAYYRNRCLACHAEPGCALPRDERLAKHLDDDCTACHMPMLGTVDIAHTAITLHTIPRGGRETPRSGATKP